MLTFLAGLILVAAAQDQDPVDAQEPTRDFAALFHVLTKAESYSFEVVVETEGGGFGRRGRGGPREPSRTIGKYEKDNPFFVKSGSVEAFRLEEMMVYRESEGEWKFFDREELMNSFRNRRNRGEGEGQGTRRGGGPSEQDMIERFDTDGDGVLSDEERAAAREAIEKERAAERAKRSESGAVEGGEGARNERGRGRSGGMRALMGLNRVDLPHETVKKIAGQLTDIARTEAEGKVSYKGTLTAEGARALVAGGMTFGSRGGFGGEAPAFEYSGDVAVVVAAGGAVEKIVITTRTSGEFMDRAFEMTRKTTLRVSDLGKVEVEVPEEALSLFVI